MSIRDLTFNQAPDRMTFCGNKSNHTGVHIFIYITEARDCSS